MYTHIVYMSERPSFCNCWSNIHVHVHSTCSCSYTVTWYMTQWYCVLWVCGCDIHHHEMNCMSITQAGYTPLITAAVYGKCDVVSELLHEGAVVDAQNNVSHFHLTPFILWSEWTCIMMNAVLTTMILSLWLVGVLEGVRDCEWGNTLYLDSLTLYYTAWHVPNNDVVVYMQWELTWIYKMK